MATLWIREFNEMGRQLVGAQPQIAMEPGVDQAPVTFSTTAASAAFGANTRFIEMCGSVAFHYVVADAPTATTNAMYVPATSPKYIGVNPGQKIAAIAAA